jgi:hypothetical protein
MPPMKQADDHHVVGEIEGERFARGSSACV